MSVSLRHTHLKETSQSDHSWYSLVVTLPRPETSAAGIEAPSEQAAPGSDGSPLTHNTLTQSDQVSSSFWAQVCHSRVWDVSLLKDINSPCINTNSLSWCLQGGQKNPWGSILSQFACAGVLLFLPSSAPEVSLSVHSSGCCHSVSTYLAGATCLHDLS